MIVEKEIREFKKLKLRKQIKYISEEVISTYKSLFEDFDDQQKNDQENDENLNILLNIEQNEIDENKKFVQVKKRKSILISDYLNEIKQNCQEDQLYSQQKLTMTPFKPQNYDDFDINKNSKKKSCDISNQSDGMRTPLREQLGIYQSDNSNTTPMKNISVRRLFDMTTKKKFDTLPTNNTNNNNSLINNNKMSNNEVEKYNFTNNNFKNSKNSNRQLNFD